MEIIGIIAEYNPFHNGHLYHIQKVKEKYPDSLIICILNGYFTQRGTPSLISKKNKTKICLENNIDLVIEHPFFFSSQSADTFAESAIFMLNCLHVNKIIFGSESNNVKELEKIARFQIKNDLKIEMKKEMKKGINYPTALAKLIKTDLNLNNPNDILGISYIKTILKNNYNIKYETIKRTNDYHDVKSEAKIISASNIRNKIHENKDISKFMPQNYTKYLNIIDEVTLFKIIKYIIQSNEKLNSFLTVDEGIENLLRKKIDSAHNINEFIKSIKTKRYTYNKLNRMLIHILTFFTKDDRQKISNPTYIKVLGFNKNGQNYLNKIKKIEKLINCKINKNDIVNKYEKRIAYLYNLITNEDVLTFEKSNKPIKKEL